MKKLLLCALAAFVFLGATGCGNEKKMSAEEAKQTLKAAAENTEKSLEKAASLKIKNSAKGSVTATDVSAMAGTVALAKVEKAKASFSADASISAAYNKKDKKAKVSADASVKLDANISSTTLKNMLGWDSPKKINYSAKASGEAYYVDGKDQANIYAKYNATLSDSIVKEFDLETGTFEGKYNFKTLYFAKLLDYIDFDDEDDDEVTVDTETTSEDDEFIKDWTIFSKKGNVIIADCSNLEAFNISGAASVQNELKKYGVEFKISKFQFELYSDNTFKSLDFTLSLDGKVDLSKVEIDKDDIKDMANDLDKLQPGISSILTSLPVDKINGKVNLDFDFNSGFEIGYKEETITAPKALTDLTETDLDALIFKGKGKADAAKKEAVKKAETVFASAKNCILEASAMGMSTDAVTKINNEYHTTAKDLLDNGEISSNPFAEKDEEDGGMYISYDVSTQKWTVMCGTIDGFAIDYEDGVFTAYTMSLA